MSNSNLLFLLLLWVKHFVILQSRLFTFCVLSVTMFIKPIIVIVGKKVVEANVFECYRPLGIIGVNEITIKNIIIVWIAILKSLL